MHGRSLAAWALALRVVTSSRTAAAEPAPRPSLRIDCPTLDDETRAAVEARAEAELASAQLPEGEVSVVCAPDWATVTWARRDGTRRERQLKLAEAGRAVDDLILEAIYQLLFVEAGAALPPGTVAPSPPAPSSRSAARPPEPLRPRRRIQIAGLAGADAELWHGGIELALGASAGVVVSPLDRWRLSVTLAPQWGVGAAGGTTAWGLRAVVRGDYRVLSHVELGLGISGRSLWAGDSGGSLQREGMTGGILVSARYVASLAWCDVSIGPRLEALARPIAVVVAGDEVFRVPSFVAGLAIDATAPRHAHD